MFTSSPCQPWARAVRSRGANMGFGDLPEELDGVSLLEEQCRGNKGHSLRVLQSTGTWKGINK